MTRHNLKRQDFAPILRAKIHNRESLGFYTDIQRAWDLFNRMEVRKLVDRATASAMSAFQLFESKEGIAIEAILHKMKHIQRNQGIKPPELGHKQEFRWEGWFYRVMKNAAFDVIPRFLFHHEHCCIHVNRPGRGRRASRDTRDGRQG